MAKIVDKTVTVTLVGRDGNAFNLMGVWSSAARRQGWSQEEIDAVLGVAMAGDYANLLRTLVEHSESEPVEDEDDLEEEDLDDGWDFGADSDYEEEYYDYYEDFEDYSDPER